MRLRGTWCALSALHSHCTAEMLTAPSNAPGRKGRPSPMSCSSRSPSTSFSSATSSMLGEMSHPTHTCPARSGSGRVKRARTRRLCLACT